MSLEDARNNAGNAMVFLTKIRDEVGNLDDIYESDCIWEIEEAESNGESE